MSEPADADFPGGRSLFDAMPQLGWVANADGFITYYNRKWYEYTGRTPAEMEGWGWQSVHDPDVLPVVLDRWNACIARGEAFEMSFPLRRHDGVFHWFHTHAAPLRSESGKVVQWIGINTDIDRQKRAEEAARNQWKRVEAMLLKAPAAIAVFQGPEHVVELVNPLFCELMGKCADQLVGQRGPHALAEMVAPGIWAELDRVLATGESFQAEAYPAKILRGEQLEDSFFNWMAQPLGDEHGHVDRILLFSVEVTHDVRERERVEALARAERAAREDAEQARARLEGLAEVALALSGAMTPREVAQVVVDRGMRSAGADTCTVYALDDTGLALELLAHRGVANEVLARIQRITEHAGNPTGFRTMREGASTWAETEADYVSLFPGLAKMKASGPRAKSFWSVPLVAEGVTAGLLGMGFYREQRFSGDERTFVETFAKQCAQALLRAQRRERELSARRWLSTTLQSIGDAVIATDTEGRITFMNPVAESLTGFTEAEARGQQLAEVFAIYSEQTGQLVESPVTKVLREGVVVGLANHTVLRSKSGALLPIDDSGAPIRDEAGRLFGVVLVFRDVSHEKRAEKRREFLASAGVELASLLDYRVTLSRVAQLAVPELADWCTVDILEPGETKAQQLAVAHADPQLLEYARRVGERYPPDPDSKTGAPQVIRSGLSELYPEIPAPLLEAAAQDEEHLRIIRELRLESAMVVPLKGVSGRTFGAMTFIYAASKRRYNDQDLAFAEDFARRAAMAIENAHSVRELEASRAREQTMRHRAELASTTKDEFLATVSHELRTPLHAILGWTVILRQRNPPAEIDRGLSIIERNARAQTRLIEDVLDVSRIISGKLILNVGVVDVAEAVGVALDAARPAAAAKSIQLFARGLDRTHHHRVAADPDRLQQILWNLLSNSIKFTPRSGTITVSAERHEGEVCVTVHDTGEGIRPDAIGSIFEPFRQADNSTTRKHGGLGLGLALVKRLVVAQGGSVEAESEGEGKGTVVRFSLPTAESVPPAEVPSRASATAAVREPKEAVRLSGLRVLLVDDETDARELVHEILQDHGAEVLTAADATEGLALLRSERPDVLVSDIGMPGIDGFAFLQRLRVLPVDQGGATPAVALTAYARREDAERAFAAGFQVHLPKPLDAAELIATVARLGGRSLTP